MTESESRIRLADESLQYSARVKELRDAGWLISNRVEICDGRKYGYFRLVSKPRVGAQTQPTTLPLFGEGGRG
jgi:hypothetical protein